MTILKDTLGYLKKSFWILALGALVPSIVISFFTKSFSSITSLPVLFTGKTDYNFTEIFILILTPISKADFWGAFLGHIVYFIFLWIGIIINISITEKHLKTGELSIKLGKHQILSYALPTLFALLLWSFFYIVCIVAQSGLISLIHYICGQTPPSVIDCILSVIISIIIFTGLIYFAIHIMFVPLIMVYYGYGFRESFVESLRLVSNNFKELFLGLFIPFVVGIFADLILNLITALLSGYAGLSEAARYWIDFIISVVSHSFMIIYLTAYDLIAFYKIARIERRDIRKHERRI